MVRCRQLTSLPIFNVIFRYGLKAVFSEVERLHHEVTSAGNPITMDMRTRYVVKGIKKEQTIDSKIQIFYDRLTGKITKVEDKWDGKLPESSFQDVSLDRLFSFWWWVLYAEGWAWWTWSFTWGTLPWQVCVCVARGLLFFWIRNCRAHEVEAHLLTCLLSS